ncbi:hypothetical protein [Paenibacillus planticolens]|nr:hypothetical protein [Paenibacillus planticolens]
MGLTACNPSSSLVEDKTNGTSVTEAPAQPSSTPQNLIVEKRKSVEELMDFLTKNVAEVEKYKQMIESNKSKVVFFNDGLLIIPERTGKYYDIYIGESLTDHIVRWHTFYVSEDMKEILVDDVITGDNVTLDEWRKRGAQ